MKLRLHRIRTDSSHILSLDIPDEYQNWYAMLVRKGAKIGDWYDVDIALPRRHRTTGDKSQNHRLNGFIQQICVDTGNEFDMVKMLVKMRAISRGYPFVTLKTGDRFPKSESESSVQECAMLIEEVEQMAAEEGIALIE